MNMNTIHLKVVNKYKYKYYSFIKLFKLFKYFSEYYYATICSPPPECLKRGQIYQISKYKKSTVMVK